MDGLWEDNIRQIGGRDEGDSLFAEPGLLYT